MLRNELTILTTAIQAAGNAIEDLRKKKLPLLKK
jgi:hypothetical protein